MWQRKFPFTVLIAIFWDLQPLWPSSLTKPDLLKFTCSCGHVLSKTKSVTPHFFTFLTSLTHHLSMAKFSERKSMLKHFSANILKGVLWFPMARLSSHYLDNFNIQYVHYISLPYFLFPFCIFLFCFYIFYISSH